MYTSAVSAPARPFLTHLVTADGAAPVSHIDIALNRAGSVKLTMNDTDSGATVAEFDYPRLAEGSNTITWDGRDNNHHYVTPGTYRLGVSGIDDGGYQSLTVYALQCVFY